MILLCFYILRSKSRHLLRNWPWLSVRSRCGTPGYSSDACPVSICSKCFAVCSPQDTLAAHRCRISASIDLVICSTKDEDIAAKSGHVLWHFVRIWFILKYLSFKRFWPANWCFGEWEMFKNCGWCRFRKLNTGKLNISSGWNIQNVKSNKSQKCTDVQYITPKNCITASHHYIISLWAVYQTTINQVKWLHY